MKRLLTVLIAVVLLGAVAAEMAQAGPQWRLRRWSSRPPIDPTIRTTPTFDASSAPNYRATNQTTTWKRYNRGRVFRRR